MRVSYRLTMLLAGCVVLYPLALTLNLLYDDRFFMAQVRWQFAMESRRTIFATVVQDYMLALPWSMAWMLNILLSDRLKRTFMAKATRGGVYILPSLALGLALILHMPLLVLLFCVFALLFTFLFQQRWFK